MRYKYDVRTGLKRIKAKAAVFTLAAAISGSAVMLGAVAVPASAEGNHQTPIKVGPIAVNQGDIGTCNNVWAQDSFNKFYTITDNKNGTYNVQVVEDGDRKSTRLNS